MKKRTILKEITVPPGGKTEFRWEYDFKNRIARLGYEIDVPEDVRNQVKCEVKHYGKVERGWKQINIHNQSSHGALVTFFEFEG